MEMYLIISILVHFAQYIANNRHSLPAKRNISHECCCNVLKIRWKMCEFIEMLVWDIGHNYIRDQDVTDPEILTNIARKDVEPMFVLFFFSSNTSYPQLLYVKTFKILVCYQIHGDALSIFYVIMDLNNDEIYYYNASLGSQQTISVSSRYYLQLFCSKDCPSIFNEARVDSKCVVITTLCHLKKNFLTPFAVFHAFIHWII